MTDKPKIPKEGLISFHINLPLVLVKEGTVVVEANLPLGVGFPLSSLPVRPAEEASDEDKLFVVEVVATNNKAAVALEYRNLIFCLQVG
jgi:hypothetical protein